MSQCETPNIRIKSTQFLYKSNSGAPLPVGDQKYNFGLLASKIIGQKLDAGRWLWENSRQWWKFNDRSTSTAQHLTCFRLSIASGQLKHSRSNRTAIPVPELWFFKIGCVFKRLCYKGYLMRIGWWRFSVFEVPLLAHFGRNKRRLESIHTDNLTIKSPEVMPLQRLCPFHSIVLCRSNE